MHVEARGQLQALALVTIHLVFCVHACYLGIGRGRNSRVPGDYWLTTIANQLALGLVGDFVLEKNALSGRGRQSTSFLGPHVRAHSQCICTHKMELTVPDEK